jgi:hypothetical protein
MSVLFLDPQFEQEVRKERERQGLGRWDEVWDGVLVVPPFPNNEYQRFVSRLTSSFSAVIDWDSGDQALPGAK